jgi:hypothetical protein
LWDLANHDRRILTRDRGHDLVSALALYLSSLLPRLQQGDKPEHDRRDGSHNTSHRTNHGPGERIHTVTIRTRRLTHLTIR